ncbi:MAG: insulinase family protein [Candidatus Aminicenantes bacterium]|nr:insulinase family protein [Candidatus Aminicenantes bacterium]
MKHRSAAAVVAVGLAILLAATGPSAGATLPVPQKIVLENGLTVFYVPDPELPLISLRLLIPGAGSAHEPGEFEGLAGLTAELTLKGTASLSAEAIAEELDFMGAGLRVFAAAEYAQVSAFSLAEHFPRLLEIAAASLSGAAFPDEEFARERSRAMDALAAAKDNPMQAVRLYFQKAYFGSHPLGRLASGTKSSLDRMTVRDARRFHGERYRPERAVAAVVGDIGRAELEALLGRTLGVWKKSEAPAALSDLPPLPEPRGKKLLLVDKPDATQAYFVLGAPGFGVADEVFPQASVMNTLFGGRFTSRLNTELRIKRGLTYGVRSSFESWRAGGVGTVSSYTRNEKIGEMLDITLEQLAAARTEGFSAEEVESGRNYILGQFPLSLESNANKAAAVARLAFYGQGFDFYDRYLDAVRAASPEAVGASASRLLPGGDFVLVVVGKAEEVRPLLRKFGEFEEKKISDPDF